MNSSLTGYDKYLMIYKRHDKILNIIFYNNIFYNTNHIQHKEKTVAPTPKPVRHPPIVYWLYLQHANVTIKRFRNL